MPSGFTSQAALRGHSVPSDGFRARRLQSSRGLTRDSGAVAGVHRVVSARQASGAKRRISRPEEALARAVLAGTARRGAQKAQQGQFPTSARRRRSMTALSDTSGRGAALPAAENRQGGPPVLPFLLRSSDTRAVRRRG